MSRTKGLAIFPANFEPQSAEPLDARSRVSTKDDLLLQSTWESTDGNPYIYVGIVVSVYNDVIFDNNGVYILTAADYTDIANWEKIGTGSGGGVGGPYDYVVGTTGNYTTVQSAIDQAVIDGAGVAKISVVKIQPGTYEEDLSIPQGIVLVGSGEGVTTIIGSASIITDGLYDVVTLVDMSMNNTVDQSVITVTSNSDELYIKLLNVDVLKTSGNVEPCVHIATALGFSEVDIFNSKIGTGWGTTCQSLVVNGIVSVFADTSSIGGIYSQTANAIDILNGAGVSIFNAIVYGNITVPEPSYLGIFDSTVNSFNTAAINISSWSGGATLIDIFIVCNVTPVISGDGWLQYKNVGYGSNKGLATTLNDGDLRSARLVMQDLEDIEALGAHSFTGFENRTDSTYTEVISEDTYAIQPAVGGGSFSYWIRGYKYTVTAPASVSGFDDKTLYYIFFDLNGTLVKSVTPWALIAEDCAPVAVVYRSGAQYAVWDERHSYKRNVAWHVFHHNVVGAMYKSGLAGTFTSEDLTIAQGVMYDEDIPFDTGTTRNSCTLWFGGAAGVMDLLRNSSTPYAVVDVGGTPGLAYDNNGVLTSVGGNAYVTNWIYVAPDESEPFYCVVGQQVTTTLNNARNAPRPVIALSTAEWKLIYQVIYRRTTPGGVETINFIEATDYRSVQTGLPTNAVAITHNAFIDRDAPNSHPSEAISHDPTGTRLDPTSTDVKTAINNLANASIHEIPDVDDGAHIAGTMLMSNGTKYVKQLVPIYATKETFVIEDIDCTVADQNIVFTVPNGRSVIIREVLLIVSHYDTVTELPTVQIGTGDDNDAFVTPKAFASSIDAIGKVVGYNFLSDVLVADTTVEVGVTEPAVATDLKVKALIKYALIEESYVILDIDCTSEGQVSLFTVPSGKNAILREIILITSESTDITETPFVQGGISTDTDLFFSSIQLSIDTAGEVESFAFMSNELSEGTVVQLGVVTAAVGTSMSVKVMLDIEIY